MYLYLVDRTDDLGYDETESVVVAANTPKQARKIAATAPGDQSSAVWETASVSNIGTARKGLRAGIVHSAFRAG